jgi:peptide/nickel transport system substrate-binding protein
MKTRYAVLFLVLLTLLVLTGAPTARAAESGGVFRLPSVEPGTLDPARLSWNYEMGIASQVMEGLTALDQNLNVVPGIAASWSSPDAKVWTFNLRSNVYFHNGRQAVANDFVYSWNRAKKAGGPYSNLFDNIASFAANGKFTFIVNLKNANAGFPSQVTLPIFYVIPKEAAGTIGNAPIGTGPFKFVKWTAGKKIVLERNPNYYGGAPYLKRVEYRFYTDTDFAKRWADFQAGKLELTQIPAAQWATYQGDPNTLTQDLMATRAVGFKMSEFDDVKVRQALQRAIDRSAIAANPAICGIAGCTLAHGVVSPGKGSYDNSDINVPYDPNGALATLASEGWTDTNSDGILDNGAGTNLSVTLPDSAAPSSHALYQAIANNLSNIGGSGVGAQVTLNSSMSAQTMLSTSWGSDYPDAENDLMPYETNAIFAQRLGYSSATFDSFLNTGRATLDEAARNAAFHSADAQLVLTDAVVVPLYYPKMWPLLKQGYVHDLVITPQGSDAIAFKTVWLTQPPPKPQLLTPANGAVIKNKTPKLDWKDSTGATYYNLELRLNSSTGKLIANPQLNVSEYKPAAPLAKKTYVWRVQACNAERCSKWAAWWSFKIQ